MIKQDYERLIKAATNILKSSSLRYQEDPKRRTALVACPHNIAPEFPTHAWWCDDCFEELEESLQEIEDTKKHIEQEQREDKEVADKSDRSFRVDGYTKWPGEHRDGLD